MNRLVRITAFLGIVLLPSSLFASICANDLCYGSQSSGLGGPHAVISTDDETFFTYDRNGDLKHKNGEVVHEYSVNRKLKKATSEAGEVRYVYAATGERARALRQFEDYERLLADAYGAMPGSETTKLYKQIRDEAKPRAS